MANGDGGGAAAPPSPLVATMAEKTATTASTPAAIPTAMGHQPRLGPALTIGGWGRPDPGPCSAGGGGSGEPAADGEAGSTTILPGRPTAPVALPGRATGCGRLPGLTAVGSSLRRYSAGRRSSGFAASSSYSPGSTACAWLASRRPEGGVARNAATMPSSVPAHSSRSNLSIARRGTVANARRGPLSRKTVKSHVAITGSTSNPGRWCARGER